MADDVLTITTEFADVASLGKGYIHRVDGQRILLPLAKKLTVGEGVRYVVHLADGTPAFAGAGRCTEVSDQGRSVAKAQRYETMVDSLQFDDRSRPVYEYIVAVRQATYGGAAAAVQAAPSVEDAETDDAELIEAEASDAGDDDEATAYMGRPRGPRSSAPGATASVRPSAPTSQAPEPAPAPIPSVMPSGMLRRPVLGVQWQPTAPRRPTPRPASGLFRHPEGPLPKPAHAPYPDLDRSQWVTRAPRPGSTDAPARSTPPAGAGDDPWQS